MSHNNGLKWILNNITFCHLDHCPPKKSKHMLAFWLIQQTDPKILRLF